MLEVIRRRERVLGPDDQATLLARENRATVLDLISEARERGAAIVGIFHDRAAREAVADREVDVSAFAPAAA